METFLECFGGDFPLHIITIYYGGFIIDVDSYNFINIIYGLDVNIIFTYGIIMTMLQAVIPQKFA